MLSGSFRTEGLAEQAHLAGVKFHEPQRGSNGCGFARAVCADETDDLAWRYGRFTLHSAKLSPIWRCASLISKRFAMMPPFYSRVSGATRSSALCKSARATPSVSASAAA